MNFFSKTLLFIIFFQSINCFSQEYYLDIFPEEYQLFSRNTENNKATVTITGGITNKRYKYVSLTVLKNETPYYTSEKNTSFKSAAFFSSLSVFDFSVPIEAGLYEYSFSLALKDSLNNSIIIAKSDKVVCGDVILFYGQSNAVNATGFDELSKEINRKFLRNYDYPTTTNNNPEELKWYPVELPSSQIGTGALGLAHLLSDTYKMPICIINGAIGGASITSLSDRDKVNPFNPNLVYGKFLTKVKKAGALSTAKVLIFRQGENEAGDACFYCAQYPANFDIFYKQITQDLPSLQKIYEGQLNIGNGIYIERAGRLRDFQRRTQQIYPKIQSFATVGTQGYECPHYLKVGYMQTALELSRMIGKDFYSSKDTSQIISPDIKSAFFNKKRDILTLVFDENQEMVYPKDSIFKNHTRRMKDFIFLNSDSTTVGIKENHTPVDSGWANGNRIFLKLKTPTTDNYITYLPSSFQDKYSTQYNGPTLQNTRGMSAFSFYAFPISLCTISEENLSITSDSSPEIYYPNKIVLKATILPNVSYQWYKNNIPIEGAIKNIYEAANSGDYSVRFKASSCVVPSNSIKLIFQIPLGVPTNNDSELALTISPNPSIDFCEISIISNKMALITVNLINSQGVLMQQWTINSFTDKHLIKLDLSKISTGIYFINAQSQRHSITQKLVKE